MQQKMEELTKANEALMLENSVLRAKLNAAEAVPIVYQGDEEDFYPDEIKDMILAALDEALANTEAATRRADILEDILKNNLYQHLSEKEKEYERICAENEDDDCEARKAHNDKIFACCKNVMKQFKQTALYKEFDSLSLNATIWEYFSDEEMLQTYEEINGKENAAEYRKFLFGE